MKIVSLRENRDKTSLTMRDRRYLDTDSPETTFLASIDGMRLSQKTIEHLRGLITGDSAETEYRSGPQLVEFFNLFGFSDTYASGFPSRWRYAQDKLLQLNGSKEMERIICALLNPVNFIDTPQFDLSNVVGKLNRFLEYDGYQVLIQGKKCKVLVLSQRQVFSEQQASFDDDFVKEQLHKSEQKIQESDYDGAITNARSLLEGVMGDIYKKITGNILPKAGELKTDYKAIKDLLNLSDEKYADENVKQILRSLVSLIDGIDRLSNHMGDRHRRRVKPRRHHAKLVVNATMTVVDFLYDSLEYQQNSIPRQ